MNTRILLTGAGGVVGHAIHQALRKTSHPLLLLSNSVEGGIAYDMHLLAQETKERIREFAPDIVIHAAWAGSDAAARNDAAILAMNHEASLALMECAIASGATRWIGFGSQAEYSPHLQEPIGEDASLAADSAYGRAKHALCIAQQTRAATARMGFVWLRLFTCYGPHMHASYLLPSLVAAYRSDKVPHLATPHAVWDFLHSDDMARGVMRVMGDAKAQGIYNLASGEGYSVEQVAHSLARLMRGTLASMSDNKDAPRRVANVEKFCRDFAWQPELSLEEGLKRFIAQS